MTQPTTHIYEASGFFGFLDETFAALMVGIAGVMTLVTFAV